MSLFVAIVALCLVIILHEAGHYFAAVGTGMKVDRFSVFGIGPAILRLGEYRDTEFVISAIPFGAYVQIRGMDGESVGSETKVADSPNFRDKPLWARALVLAGGPGANYIGAFLIFFGVFLAAGGAGPPDAIQIGGFGEVSAARDAGLQVGDALVKIGDVEVDPTQGPEHVVAASTKYLGQVVDVTVRREDALVTATLQLPKEAPALGVGLQIHSPRVPVGVGEAAKQAVQRPFQITGEQLSGLYRLITGQLKAELQGPVGIVKHIARSAEFGVVPFLLTAGFISTLLGLFNLLPIPALDGGRLMFLAYTAISRRAPSARLEEAVHGIGMLALLLLIAVVTYGDIVGR